MEMARPPMPCPLELSAKAISEVRNILKEKKIPFGYGLRVGVNGGGCSGITYFIGFDQQKSNDDIYVIDEVPLYIEKKHSMFLWGLQVDFIETGEERGFIFNTKK